MSGRMRCWECKDEVSGVGGWGVKISQNWSRLASRGQNIEIWEKWFFAPISAHNYATFKPNLYLCWSLPLIRVKTCIKIKDVYSNLIFQFVVYSMLMWALSATLSLFVCWWKTLLNCWTLNRNANTSFWRGKYSSALWSTGRGSHTFYICPTARL